MNHQPSAIDMAESAPAPRAPGPVIPRELVFSLLVLLFFGGLITAIVCFYYSSMASSLVRKGSRLRSEGKSDEALAAYRQSLYFNGKNSMAFTLLGEEYLRRGDMARAFFYLQKGAACRPVSGMGLYYLGAFEASRGNYRALDRILGEVPDLSPQDRAYGDLLRLYCAVMVPGESSCVMAPEEWKSLLNKLIAGADSPFMRTHLGLIAIYGGSPEKAERIFKSLVAENPDRPCFQTYLAMAFMASGKTPQALTMLNGALQQDKENYLALCYLGSLYCGEKLYDEAYSSLSRAIAIGKDRAPGYFFMGELFYRRGETAKARTYLEKSVLYQPNLGPAYSRLHETYKKLKISDRADASYKNAAIYRGPLTIPAPSY
ncbi:MAG: tetratricopeptide repeat protein [Candidatus Eremiobacteraeota bacterium]|nr:tetratricopeptide repeat protein [Candidatus Eremiobacteraeota bacterium]